MMFSTKAEYGVRVMVELARRAGDEPVPLAEIAAARGPPARLPRAPRGAPAQGRAGRQPPRLARRLPARPRPPARSRWPRSSRRWRARSRRSSASRGRRRLDRVLARVRPGARLPDQAAVDARARVDRADAARDDTRGSARDAASPADRTRKIEPLTTGAQIENMAELEIRDLHVRTEEREILRGVDLDDRPRRDPRADGPQRLRQVDARQHPAGPPRLRDHGGRRSSSTARTSPRPSRTSAPRLGLFLAFQYPVAIPGVSVANFLRMAINAQREEPIQVKEFRDQLAARGRAARRRPLVHLAPPQRRLLRRREEARRDPADGDAAPEIAILDETDSGLDIDALRTVAEGVQRLHDEQGLGALIITHYQRILHYVKPEFVHVLMDGRIVLEGGVELVERLEREGYDQIRQEVGAASRGMSAQRATRATARKAGRHREATLYHALAGAGAGDGRRWRSCARPRARAYERLRAAALAALGLLDDQPARASTSTPRDARRTRRRGAARRSSRARCPTAPRAGRIVQSAGSVVARRARRGARRSAA